MATITEQIDIFHESICRLHLYQDVLDVDELALRTGTVVQKYYSIDEYTMT